MKEIKLLLADDQDLIRESLHIVLDMDPDIEVVALAENGEAAVAACRDKQPNVVLMDIHMPVMDGVEATKRIKAQWPETRVIIVTTFQEVGYVVEALGAGAEGYLLKAIHPKDLVAGIKWVHSGGTLIPQDIARLLVDQVRTGGAGSGRPSGGDAGGARFGGAASGGHDGAGNAAHGGGGGGSGAGFGGAAGNAGHGDGGGAVGFGGAGHSDGDAGYAGGSGYDGYAGRGGAGGYGDGDAGYTGGSGYDGNNGRGAGGHNGKAGHGGASGRGGGGAGGAAGNGYGGAGGYAGNGGGASGSWVGGGPRGGAGSGSSAAAAASVYGLSERELQVLHSIADGLNNKEIAEKLFLSEGTVKNYISNIYSKMDVRDRIQAARKAQDEGML